MLGRTGLAVGSDGVLTGARVQVLKDAKTQVNRAARRKGRPEPHTDLDRPNAGVKIVASGDHLQQVAAAGGIGRVLPDGTAEQYAPPPSSSDVVWGTSVFRDRRMDVLTLIIQGNHRLVGKMRIALATGCVFSAYCHARVSRVVCRLESL